MEPVERVARMIDPSAWRIQDSYGVVAAAEIGITTDLSMERARAILALIPYILVGKTHVEMSYHEDDIYPPRDHWHMRLNLGGLSTDWRKVGKQEQKTLPTPQYEEAASRLRDDLRQDFEGMIQ